MPGAKILVSGGGRCNVTNRVVTERDYWGGPSAIVRRVLRALPVDDTVRFFAAAGVPLHEEHDGKLFPDSNRARDVLDALLRQAGICGVERQWPRRVSTIVRRGQHLAATTDDGVIAAARIVIATGGQSLPKTGSDGAGFQIARALGHTIVSPTPALAPLLLPADGGLSPDLPCMRRCRVWRSMPTLTIWVDGRAAVRLRESLLWTHFGISGPVALNASRHWLRATLEQQPVAVTASFVPDASYDDVERLWLERARDKPLTTVATTLATLVPASLAAAMLQRLTIDPALPLAELRRDDRRRLTRGLTEWPLPVAGSRGYNYAEATAGGVDLREIEPKTMESRKCPGLYLVGEVLDVDGRIGGFNFQWAWSSAAAAASALARPLSS